MSQLASYSIGSNAQHGPDQDNMTATEAAKAFQEMPAAGQPYVLRLGHREGVALGGTAQIVGQTTWTQKPGEPPHFAKYASEADPVFRTAYYGLDR